MSKTPAILKPQATTSTKVQRLRVFEALTLSPKTTEELRELGIFCPARRVLELRKEGYDIRTERVNIYDAHGYPHRGMGLYILHSEPEPFNDLEGAA